MPWWAWMILGFVFLVAEMLLSGAFYLLFFGLGGLAVGLLALLGPSGPLWLEWVVFTALSIGAIAMLRPATVRLLARKPAVDVDDTIVGETATVSERIEPGALGSAELRGSRWTARNAGSDALVPGDRGLVTRVDGLTLHVRRSV